MSTAKRMPVLFVGHGSPMNAIEDNHWSRAFRGLSAQVPAPRAVLAVSAHWVTRGTRVTAQREPRTIHDFGGFSQALFDVQYPAPGSPALADHVLELMDTAAVKSDLAWGLDHGSWSVLRWMYPNANIPVLQLSLDAQLTPAEHLEVARSLAPLRDEGVLILGSGNVVHNLSNAMQFGPGSVASAPAWAQGFDDAATDALRNRQTGRLLTMPGDSEAGRMAHPTTEHWLPLLYAYGASDDGDRLSFPITGFDWGSISMRSVFFGHSELTG